MNEPKTTPRKFTITKTDLANSDKYAERITDHPVYGHTSGLTDTDIVLLSKILQYEHANGTELNVTITVTNPAKAKA